MGLPEQSFQNYTSDLESWRDQVAMAFDASHWDNMSQDDRHRAITERIGQPLRVKLLYDSYLWKHILDTSRVEESRHIVELLPGWSHTLAVALESNNFSGQLTQVDLERPTALITPFPYKRVWLKRNIFDPIPEIYDATYILGNHITDDILVCQAQATESARQHYYSSPELSRDIWRNLANDPQLEEYLTGTGNCLTAIANALRPGQTLILREYPSTTAVIQGDVNRWELELAVQAHVFDTLENLGGLDASRPDLSNMPVPPGSRFPESVLELTRPIISEDL